MILPEYVTAKEVARVCAEIGMDDWSKRTEAVVSAQECSKTLAIVNTEGMPIPLRRCHKSRSGIVKECRDVFVLTDF